jgi:hypothetical protein
MRRTGIVLVLACTIALLAACKDDREEIETMYSGFMTGQTNAQGYISVLKDDFGRLYTVSEKTEKFRPDTLYRLVASVALDEDNNAKVIQAVPTISYIAPPDSIIPDSMRVKDPIKIESIYIGGGYLNINVGIKVKNEDSQHSLFYTCLDNTDKLKFTFYHNAYGDGDVYTKHAYVSIPLYGYGLAKNDTVFLSCKGYQEDYDYKLIYK